MSRKYYVISMDSAWSPYRPCIGCPNNASDDDGHICHGGTDCPLLTAREASVVPQADTFISEVKAKEDGKKARFFMVVEP